ncbi:transcription factor bHLH18-like [Hordeum vulgare subsp. vulgare]|uniref:BHLH domain-containing protein n=1 Tax=Hordeum vulgare subsp. vulgare TaxID=112509 RepID=A0A8I6WY03_HORVV|nr:transcription factor bHLH18-like [Hordeum vulgare subsp. vulgare]
MHKSVRVDWDRTHPNRISADFGWRLLREVEYVSMQSIFWSLGSPSSSHQAFDPMYQLEAMDDSSLFMQWAVDTLQHEHPPAPAAAYAGGGTFPSLEELRRSALQHGTAQDGHRHLAADSWSSGDSAGGGHENTSAAVVENDVWSSNSAKCATACSVGSSNHLPMSWNFTSALAQPSNEAPAAAAPPSGAHDGPGVTVPEQAHVSAPTSRRASAAKGAARAAGHTPYAQDHIMAERKRREKINRRFIELSTVIPGLKKMDKATILSDAVKYVKEQQEKLKALEDRSLRSVAVESVVLVKKKSRTAAAAPEDDCPSPSAGAVAVSTTTTTTTGGSALPEIEARITESNVMVRIHCEDSKGVLVRLLAEVEGLHLSITHANAIQFPACTVIITVMAKVDDGFSVTAEDIIAKVEAALPAPTS